jgi:hypothetical protein
MSYGQARLCKICFALCFALGCFFLFMVLFEGVLPHALLDAVLTPEELRDQVTRDWTMEILKKGGDARSVFWMLSGVATILASGVGYRAACARIDPKVAPHTLDDEP